MNIALVMLSDNEMYSDSHADLVLILRALDPASITPSPRVAANPARALLLSTHLLCTVLGYSPSYPLTHLSRREQQKKWV